MAVFFRCVCSVVETFEQEPYERRLQQLNDIRTFLQEGKLREAALIVRDLKFDLEVNKTTQALGNVDLVGRLNAPQVLADPDTHEYMWGIQEALLDCDQAQASSMCQLLITQFDFSANERLRQAFQRANIKLFDSTFTNRRSIKIFDCDFSSGKNFKKALASIEKNPHLKKLEINCCKMSNKQARKTLEVLSVMKHLYKVDFKGNRLTMDIIEDIIELLEDEFLFPCLWWISLENNENINVLPGKLLQLFSRRWKKNPVVEETPPSLMPSIRNVTNNSQL